ncbi:MAG: molybdenum cofactor guanylyltransferase [Burkholderiaceae bacterium]|nr:molybdenum cofactor guanylyltransferase [Burkholderiaceae bacterium]
MNSPQRLAAESITGLILCGGAGSRMGGVDKGLIDFHGKKLIDIAIDRLRPQVGPLIINANRNLRDYQTRELPVISDPRFGDDDPGFQGPLAGILAGLQATRTSWMVTVPCDCPLFPNHLVEDLLKANLGQQQGAYIASHPTFALIPASATSHLEHFLQHGQRRLGQWLAEIGATPVAAHEKAQFRNLNTPQDLGQ